MEGNLANLGLKTDQLENDLPDGEYVTKVTADVIKDDSLTLTFTVFDGPFYGRTIKSTYKLWSAIEKTREGAKTAFLFLCKSLGVNEPRDTSDLRGIPFVMVFTKADKLGTEARRRNVENYLNEMRKTWEELPQHFVTSAEKKEGAEEILDFVEQTNKLFVKP